MDDNLFDQGRQEPEKYFEELTRTGGKFDRSKYESDEALHEAIAQGKYKADAYIEAKNRQYDDLYNDYLALKERNDAGEDLQKLVDQLRSQQTDDSTRDNTFNPNDVKPAAIDPKEIESLVSTQVQKLRQNEREEANYNQVRERLQDTLGSSYKDTLKKQADDLGMSDDEVNAMARRNPKLFYRTFGLDAPREQQNFQAPPHNQLRGDLTNKGGRELRTLSYYENLRKANPDLYFDRKTVIQMDKDAQLLGEAFFDI